MKTEQYLLPSKDWVLPELQLHSFAFQKDQCRFALHCASCWNSIGFSPGHFLTSGLPGQLPVETTCQVTASLAYCVIIWIWQCLLLLIKPGLLGTICTHLRSPRNLLLRSILRRSSYCPSSLLVRLNVYKLSRCSWVRMKNVTRRHHWKEER